MRALRPVPRAEPPPRGTRDPLFDGGGDGESAQSSAKTAVASAPPRAADTAAASAAASAADSSPPRRADPERNRAERDALREARRSREGIFVDGNDASCAEKPARDRRVQFNQNVGGYGPGNAPSEPHTSPSTGTRRPRPPAPKAPYGAGLPPGQVATG